MKTSCEFRFGFWDVTARGDARLSAEQNQPFADISDINSEEDITFPDVATLEPNFGWPLDGSKELLSKDAADYTWGWWSTELSGDDLSFANKPELEVGFFDDDGSPTPHSSVGITLTFAYTMPKKINIKWYDAQSGLLADEYFYPDTMKFLCECKVENYYSVIITVHSMQNPGRFLRVTGILFGALEILDSARLTKAVLTEEISPAALTLPINKASLSFHSSGNRFELLNPSGAYTMFQWRQQLTGFKTVNGQKSPIGQFYFQKATGAVDGVTSLECVDIIGILDTLEYKGGIYESTPVKDLLEDILVSEGIDFELDNAFASATVSGHLPVGSKRSALQQIAFAIGAIVDTTRGQLVRLYPMPVSMARTITSARKIVGHNVRMDPIVTQVEVTAHSYVLDTELKELAKPVLDAGTHDIPFASPVKVTKASGALIVTNHPNYCTVSVAAAGEVILSGYEYNDVQTVSTVKTAALPAGVKNNPKRYGSATLVDPSKAPTVARRIYDYYQLCYIDEGRLLPGDERVGELVDLTSLNGNHLNGYIHQIVTDLVGGCLETITLRGGVK